MQTTYGNPLSQVASSTIELPEQPLTSSSFKGALRGLFYSSLLWVFLAVALYTVFTLILGTR